MNNQFLRAIVRGGLGRLEHLQTLELRTAAMLSVVPPHQQQHSGAGHCWGQLQELTLGSCAQLSDTEGAGLASLRSLRSLDVSNGLYCDAAEDLLPLLCHLPPSLATLKVSMENGCVPLEAAVEAGQLVEVTAHAVARGPYVRCTGVLDLGHLAERLLVPYLDGRRATLRRLTLRQLSLAQAGNFERPEGPAALAHAGQLLRRCQVVELEELQLSVETPAASVAQAVELLGPPRRLCLKVGSRHPVVLLVPWLRASEPAGAAVETAGGDEAASGGGGAWQLPPPQQVLAAAASRLLAMPPPAQPNAEVGGSSPAVLVLRGPLVHALAQTPQLLKGWVRWLVSEALAARQSAGARADPHATTYYQLLPNVQALLVQSVSSCNNRWLDAAVRSVAPGAHLEAAWVAPRWLPPILCRTFLPWPFIRCLQQELDKAWARLQAGARGGGGSGGGGGGGAGSGSGGPDSGGGEADEATGSSAGTAAALQETVLWLQQLGRVVEAGYLQIEEFRD
ncbi:hypothetical protein HYH02_007430 [Chlamydomonas schloesseri]|uniref:Uncharacterized protein n=1 Tax=Chlamydomonas schloesseri TaxID=2026947 RepID=A0A835WHF5_9CHLO|nr:hypothetical protein HYH02_007430 [Chlamydomonas schloesseri]|eukprot:KAG2447505.1 hypothetical protein HYH02_007430 [Chlamydomonas schloesseri]